MKIEIKGEKEAYYEKRFFNSYEGDLWCLTRSGEIIRWLDKYQVTMIESVLEYMGAD